MSYETSIEVRLAFFVGVVYGLSLAFVLYCFGQAAFCLIISP